MIQTSTTPPPRFRSLDDLVQFLEVHDLEAFDEALPPAFEQELSRRTYSIIIDEALMNKLDRLAKAQFISPDTLIHTWLAERLAEEEVAP